MVAANSELPNDRAAPSSDAIPLEMRRRGGTPSQVFTLTLVGALVLAVFASHDLSSWLNRLGDGPILEPIQRVAARWDGAVDKLGLTGPHEALRRAIRLLLDWQWDSPP